MLLRSEMERLYRSTDKWFRDGEYGDGTLKRPGDVSAKEFSSTGVRGGVGQLSTT